MWIGFAKLISLFKNSTLNKVSYGRSNYLLRQALVVHSSCKIYCFKYNQFEKTLQRTPVFMNEL